MLPFVTPNSGLDLPATLTLQEASNRLGRSLKAIRRAAEAGELPVIRWGRTYLVLREPFERLLRGEDWRTSSPD